MVKRVRPARDYQRPDAPVRQVAIRGRAIIRRSIKQALTHLQDMVPQAPAEHKIRAGAYDQVKDVIAWGHWREVLKEPFNKIADVHALAADIGVRKINAAFCGRRVRFRTTVEPARLISGAALFKDIGDRFNFDRFDQRTINRLRDAQDVLIRQLTSEARDTIDSLVIAGVRQNLEPSEIVDDIRRMIGLTDTQAQAVVNYRAALESGTIDSLRRQLREREFDATIRQAVADGSPLDQAFIDRAVRAYEDNYLDYRANAIAQTESVRASNAGLHDSYRQAIERGALPADAITRFWQISLNENVCPICTSIPDMNPDGVSVDQEFKSIDGPYFDAPIHPHCECSVEYVTDLDKLPED